MGDAAFVVKDPVAAKRNDSILRNIITGGRSGSAANNNSNSSTKTSTSHVTGGPVVPEFSLWKVSALAACMHTAIRTSISGSSIYYFTYVICCMSVHL
jgi:hypothetical protein